MSNSYLNLIRETQTKTSAPDELLSNKIVGIRRLVLVTCLATSGVIHATVSVDTTKISFNHMRKANLILSQPGEMKMKEVLASLNGSTGWVNSSPIKSNDLRGKVVLVDFCTYTCINWMRTIPYLRAWSKKYKDQGLVTVGIHTPEFVFEQNLKNVRREIGYMNIDYPIATDNNYAVWQEFDNAYWPALYLVDATGVIRHHQFGEGGYEQIERMIQKLLIESGSEAVNHDLVDVKGIGVEAAPDWSNLKSPENYTGVERTENFMSPGGAALEMSRSYNPPANLQLNQWALSGEWTFKKQSVLLNRKNGRIVYRFHSRDLHMVMGSINGEKEIRFRILVDGKPIGSGHGVDVDDKGYGTVKGQRLYQLIRQSSPIIEREFEIEFFDEEAEVFSFTFG
jgi:hypothetical protein